MVRALELGGAIGWRSVFYITGSLGVLLSVLVFFGVRDVPRGTSEPELVDLEHVGQHRFERRVALDLFRKPTLLVMFVQGFSWGDSVECDHEVVSAIGKLGSY